MWWWGFQVLLTNAYKVYCESHKMHQSDDAMTHYDFIKSVALAWLDREANWPNKRKRKRTCISVDDTSLIINSSRSRRNQNKVNYKEPPGSSSSTESESSNSTIATAFLERNATLTTRALKPNGKLKCRLNTYITHSPCPSNNKRAKCQLHRWARGRNEKEVRGGKAVVHCSTCRVDLCFKCWRTFHSCTDIIGMKEQIAKS